MVIIKFMLLQKKVHSLVLDLAWLAYFFLFLACCGLSKNEKETVQFFKTSIFWYDSKVVKFLGEPGIYSIILYHLTLKIEYQLTMQCNVFLPQILRRLRSFLSSFPAQITKTTSFAFVDILGFLKLEVCWRKMEPTNVNPGRERNPLLPLIWITTQPQGHCWHWRCCSPWGCFMRMDQSFHAQCTWKL